MNTVNDITIPRKATLDWCWFPTEKTGLVAPIYTPGERRSCERKKSVQCTCISLNTPQWAHQTSCKQTAVTRCLVAGAVRYSILLANWAFEYHVQTLTPHQVTGWAGGSCQASSRFLDSWDIDLMFCPKERVYISWNFSLPLPPPQPR